jgi:hypothetical protein
MTVKYIVLAYGGIEPDLCGPYANDWEQIKAARAFRAKSDEDSIFWMDVHSPANVDIGSYAAGEIDPEFEEDWSSDYEGNPDRHR